MTRWRWWHVRLKRGLLVLSNFNPTHHFLCLTGAITARLATEVTLVKNVTGQNLGRSVQNLVTIAAAFTIAFAFGSLKMSLVLLGILPLMVIGSFAQMKALRANTDASQDRVAKSGAVAVQAISGIRTVTAFGMNTKLLSLYSQALQRPMELGIKSGLLKGITLGMSQFISLSSYGLLFWYGSTLVLDSPVEERGSAFQHMLRSLMAVRVGSSRVIRGRALPFHLRLPTPFQNLVSD